MKPPEDHRYIVTVSLNRSGRNKYWEFHCPYCQQKVCELDGSVVYMGDVFNEAKEPPLLIRCPGTNKKWCRYWFGFLVS